MSSCDEQVTDLTCLNIEWDVTKLKQLAAFKTLLLFVADRKKNLKTLDPSNKDKLLIAKKSEEVLASWKNLFAKNLKEKNFHFLSSKNSLLFATLNTNLVIKLTNFWTSHLWQPRGLVDQA